VVFIAITLDLANSMKAEGWTIPPPPPSPHLPPTATPGEGMDDGGVALAVFFSTFSPALFPKIYG
jgi:hypothetical protein